VLENIYWIFPIVFFSSLAVSSLSVPFLKKLAFKFAIIDEPNQAHKTHSSPIPYLGGLAIVIPVLIVSALSVYLLQLSKVTMMQGILVVVPGLILAIIGLIDDKNNLSAAIRLVIQLIMSILISLILIQGEYAARITEISMINILISIFWIVGITNAFNFLDNLDGAAAGITVISSAAIFALSLMGDQYLIATFSLTICAGSLGFLFWNLNPARIYLGDSGALFIGLILSVLLLQLEPSTAEKLSSIAIPVLVMAIPIIDTCVVVFSRFLRGVSIFQGGRDHLSHRIIALGFNRKQAALFIWTIGAFYAFLAVAIDYFSFAHEDALSMVGLISIFVTTIIFLRQPHL
jgi:UDP-GlcNAc:undecaprenyl-phosphate/decaprenyl-phosphate GlcNAc-1-phosphate transferase